MKTGAGALTGQGEAELDLKRHPGGGAVRRVGPALIMITLALGTVIAGGWFFAAMVMGCCVLMLLEWQTMTNVERTSPIGVLQSATGVAAIGLAALGLSQTGLTWAAPEAGLAVVGIGAIGAGLAASLAGQNVAHAVMGVLYICLPCLAALWLRALPEVGLFNILWLYAVVWAGDTGAYGFGRWLGGPKLAPVASPNKTWAGAIGGAAASVAAGVAAASLMGGFSSLLLVMAMSLVIAVIAQMGDLVESVFKRSVNVKDSGSLLPGHGGLLDRLDAFLAAVSAVFLIHILFAVEGPIWGW
jgi:phosphatidate cytidylyltransferase